MALKPGLLSGSLKVARGQIMEPLPHKGVVVRGLGGGKQLPTTPHGPIRRYS